MRENLPKILFITVNGWNNTTGESTISSIIKDYPAEKVANIFIRADKPNAKVCDKYFRIDEFKIFKSIFLRKTKTGYVVKKEDEGVDFNKELTKQVNLKKFSNVFTPILREIAWKFSNWKNKEMLDFVSEFNPDLIITSAEALIHFNNLGMYISKYFNKPLGVFFWDDNFTYKAVLNPVRKFFRFFQRRNIKKMAKRASFGFSINPKMQQECISELGFKTEFITKPIIGQTDCDKYLCGDVSTIKLLYTGNLYIDRDKTILKLIEAIKSVNSKKSKKKFFLDIYTNTVLSDEEKKLYNIEKVSSLHPAVTKEEVMILQKNTDILLFAEALDGKYKNIARLSFSTKLTEYFSSRKCIFAIAPSDIAPTEYLRDNDIAIVASTQEEIKHCLEKIADNLDLLEMYSEKAYNFGKEYHGHESIYKTFVDTITKFC